MYYGEHIRVSVSKIDTEIVCITNFFLFFHNTSNIFASPMHIILYLNIRFIAW